MSPQVQIQAAHKALKAKAFEDAIAQFQAVCTQIDTPSALLSEAQMWLAIAYKKSGQPILAKPIAEHLQQSDDLVTRRWANQFLSHLGLPTEEEEALQTPEGRLAAGQLALEAQRYPDAIEHLLVYCQTQSPDAGLESGQAYLNLANAYKGNGQIREAMQICQQLEQNPESMVQMAAMQLIASIEELLYNSPFLSIPVAQVSEAEQSTEANANSPILKPRSLEELKVFFRKHLLFALAKYEEHRKVTAISILVATLIFLVLSGALIFGVLAIAPHLDKSYFNAGMRYDASNLILLPPGILMFLIWAWIAFSTSAMETFVRGFKARVIQRLVRFIDPNGYLTYNAFLDPQAEIEHLVNAQLFQTASKSIFIDQDDCISGQIGNTKLFFSEIAAYSEHRGMFHSQVSLSEELVHIQRSNISSRDAGEDMVVYLMIRSIGQTFRAIPYILTRLIKFEQIHYSQFQEEILENKVSRKRIFKGLFFRAQFNKRVKGKTVVLPDNLLTRTTWLNSHRGESIKLEDPEFEKFFEVYGDDQVESRYALSTSLMAKLVELRKKSGKDRSVYVSLVEDTIYIAIASDRDLFEPRLYRSILDFNLVRQYFEDLQLMAGIVDELNLNRRIWMTSDERSMVSHN